MPTDTERRIVDAFDVPRRLVFSELTDEDRSHDAERQRHWDTELAWHRWATHSCIEWNGDHDMRLRAELGGSPEVQCATCPADIDDFYPDGWGMLTYDLPVTVQVETHHYRATPDHGDEWDVTIDLEPRS